VAGRMPQEKGDFLEIRMEGDEKLKKGQNIDFQSIHSF
jgi:hypothetical protein